MQLSTDEIHIWSASLVLTPEQEAFAYRLLSSDELTRAQRFHFPIHRQRFTAARGMLRQLLGQYLSIAPSNIQFDYTEHHKPYVINAGSLPIQFNLAHSHDIAVFAFTLSDSVGIDIEKVEENPHIDLVHRFFSERENQAYLSLPEKARIRYFYRLWAHKEAILKASGKGLHTPLREFTVIANENPEKIVLEGNIWWLTPLLIDPGYEAALAVPYQDKHKIIRQNQYQLSYNENP